MNEVFDRQTMHPVIQALLLLTAVAASLLMPVVGIVVAAVVSVVAFRHGARLLGWATAAIALAMLAILLFGYPASSTITHEVS